MAHTHAPAHDHHGHSHGHDHHGHSHGLGGHSHVPADFGRTFAIATALNIALVVAQVIYGFYAHSLALLADAGHNFGDVMGLVMAWLAYRGGRLAAEFAFHLPHARGLDPLGVRQRH